MCHVLERVDCTVFPKNKKGQFLITSQISKLEPGMCVLRKYTIHIFSYRLLIKCHRFCLCHCFPYLIITTCNLITDQNMSYFNIAVPNKMHKTHVMSQPLTHYWMKKFIKQTNTDVLSTILCLCARFKCFFLAELAPL